MEEDVDTLPVPDVLPRALLTQPQQAGGGQGQELLQSVLDVIVTSKVVFIFSCTFHVLMVYLRG